MNRTFKKVKNDPQKEYAHQKAAIEKLLREIQSGLEKHERNAGKFKLDHYKIGLHWGHVGDLTSIADKLKDIRDCLHGTGEYA